VSAHLPDPWLDAFVAGTLSEARAVEVAEHLDACPACLARVTATDPLTPLFAAAPDAEPPRALAGAIQRALRTPPHPSPGVGSAPAPAPAPTPVPWRELLLGGALLATAAALALWMDMPFAGLLEEPMVAWRSAAQTWRAVSRAGDALQAAWRGPLLLLLACGCGALATAAWGTRHHLDLRGHP